MSAGARPDPPPARQPRPGHDLVVDTNGEVLGLVRSPDAPIFGIDVVAAEGAHRRLLLGRVRRAPTCSPIPTPDVAGYVAAARTFFSDPAALTGSIAFSRPRHRQSLAALFPGRRARPPARRRSRARSREFNPFSTGLQSALITDNVLTHVGFILGANPDTPQTLHRARRSAGAGPARQRHPDLRRRSVPIYRGNTLVGGIGVSGDGIDQDDMIASSALHNAGVRARHAIGNAARRDPLRPDRDPGRQHQRPAALRQLPVQAVPRHERAECLPGQMTRRGRPPLADGVGGRSAGAGCRTRSGRDRRRVAGIASLPRCRTRRRQAPRGQPAEPAPPPTSRRAAAAAVEEELIDGRRRPDIERELPDPVEQVNPGAIRSPPPEAFPADHIADPRPLAADRDARHRPRALVRPLQPEHAQGRPAALHAGRRERGSISDTLGCRAFRAPRPPERRLVLRRQRHLRHGDRAAHLPDPGRRPDHPAAGQQRRVRRATTASSLVADLHRQRRPDQGHRPPSSRPTSNIALTLALQRQLCRRARAARARSSSRRAAATASIMRSASRKRSSTITSATSSDRYDFDSRPRRHPAVQLRFPRLPVPGPAARHPPVRQSRQQPLPVQSRGDLAAGEGHQFGPQRPLPDARATTGSCTPTSIRQDFPFVGLTSQVSLTWNINRERDEIEVDDNGFPVRPALIGNLRARNYDVFYLGYNADGQIGRMNLTASLYGAVRLGPEQHLHRPQRADRRASSPPPSRAIDFNWIRIRGAGPVRERRRRSLRRCRARLRRDLRESDLRRRRHQLLDPPDHPVRRRRPRGLAQRPQRHPQLAALVEGAGPVQLRQSGHDAARRRRRFRPHARSCACRPTSTISGSTRPRCCRRCAMQGTIRRDIGWDLSAAAIWRPQRDPERRLPPLRRGARSRAPAFATCSTTTTATGDYYSVLFNAILTY